MNVSEHVIMTGEQYDQSPVMGSACSYRSMVTTL